MLGFCDGGAAYHAKWSLCFHQDVGPPCLVCTQMVMRDYPLSAELIKERAAHRARSLQVRIGRQCASVGTGAM